MKPPISNSLDQFVTRNTSKSRSEVQLHNKDTKNSESAHSASVPELTPSFKATKWEAFEEPRVGTSLTVASTFVNPFSAPLQCNRGRHDLSQDPLMVKIRYGKDDSTRVCLGQRVERILNSNISVLETNLVSPPSSVPSAQMNTHPFFLEANARLKPRKSTKFNQLSHILNPRSRASTSESTYQTSKMTGSDKLARSYSRNITMDPLWPPQDMVHVCNRGSGDAREAPMSLQPRVSPLNRRKRKGRLVEIIPCESVLKDIWRITPNLLGRNPRDEDDIASKREMSNPTRLTISGSSLREYVGSELYRSSQQDETDDSVTLLRGKPSTEQPAFSTSIHAAIHHLYRNLPIALSPFDRGRSTQDLWVDKYAPRLANRILQSSTEATILKEWVKSLILHTSTKDSDRLISSNRQRIRKRLGQKRRRSHSKELGDFIVSSEDEAFEEYSRNCDSKRRGVEGGTGQKSALGLRQSDLKVEAKSKSTNLILLSGPNGCGKTAAVFAVAKELGFNIFEMGSNTRRSSKDLLEHIGDMILNHQVRKDECKYVESAGSVCPTGFRSTQLLRAERGATNTSLVPVKNVTRLEDKLKLDSVNSNESQHTDVSQHAQSLILLEEVDILFEEDKQFFEAVADLAAQSKRPIIMTCNDESILPSGFFDYHTILRFKPPQPKLAVDYLLLMAASEGHLLKRSAVEHIYMASKLDLRASISNLNFWCQLGLNDQRGGFEWHLKRWPPGTDHNLDGEILRVISANTYSAGVESRVSNSSSDPQDVEKVYENQLADFLTDRRYDLMTIFWKFLSENWLATYDTTKSTSEKFLQSLMQPFYYSVDLLSSIDILSHMGLPGNSMFDELLDATQSTSANLASGDYVAVYPVLKTPVIWDYHQLDARLIAFIAVRLESLLTKHMFLRPELTEANQSESQATYVIVENDIHNQMKNSTQVYRRALAPILDVQEDNFSSQYHREIGPIAQDIGPFIRLIAASDLELEQRRKDVLDTSFNGQRIGKRVRTTRASRSAFEGLDREKTRRSRWLPCSASLIDILSTGGQAWKEGISSPVLPIHDALNLSSNIL